MNRSLARFERFVPGRELRRRSPGRVIVVRGEGPLDVVDEFAHAMQANETFDLNTSVLADRRLNGCGRQLIRHQCGWVFVECQFVSSVGEAGNGAQEWSVCCVQLER